MSEPVAYYALSHAQKRLWFLAQLEPEHPFYNIAGAATLRGPLNVPAFHEALQRVADGQESLRTSFAEIDGEPYQRIAARQVIPLPLEDLSHQPQASQVAAISRSRAQDAQQPFDLASGPLLRVRLLRLAEEEHVLLYVMHHIMSDGWSMGVLVKDMAACYNALVDGETPVAPALPVQYKDYAAWQNRMLEDGTFAAQQRYWLARLAGPVPVLNLPTDRPRPPLQSHRGAIVPLDVDPSLTRGLMTIARARGATLFMLLLTALYVLLSKLTGQSDLIIGSPTANRRHKQLEPVIGFFVNTLALRADLSGNPSFADLLHQVKQRCLEAFANQDYPFDRLVEVLNPARDLSRSPLFSVMLAYQGALLEGNMEHAFRRLVLRTLPNDWQTARFDLQLFAKETATGLSLSLEYNTDLFRADTARRFLAHFEALLEAIVAAPQAQLSALSVLNDAQRAQLVTEWNATDRWYRPGVSLHQLFEAQVERTPDAVALVCEGQQLTYVELNAKANQLAHHLRGMGIGADAPVGLCMERSIEMVVGLFGILKAGGAYMALDPAYPSERLAYMLADARPGVLLIQACLLAALADPPAGVSILCLDREWNVVERAPKSNPQPGNAPANLAYVMYTSGSTGKPKGVGIDHAGIVNRLLWMQEAYGLTEADRVLQKTPFSFDVSVWEFFWPLANGAALILAKPGGHQDPRYLSELIVAEGVTTMHFVPPMLEAFLDAPGVVPCVGLKRILCSGQALPLELQQRCFDQLGHVELHNLYGPTEASVDVTAWQCRPDADLASVPIGRPIANTQIYILDEQLEPVPVGVPGELHIAGVGLARGYLNRAALTAEKFIPNPFATAPGSRLYRSGDLARYLADGDIEYLGRLDQQVKIRGFRIELGEIEAALLELTEVREAVVLAREDSPGDKRLVAYVVPAPVGLQVDAVRAALQRALPAYMVPAHFIVLEQLPLSPNAKLDRKALPTPDARRGELGYVAPRTPGEAQLATIWAEVLKRDQVGVHDNFFALGGDSILSLQIIARARQAGLQIAPKELFQHPSIAQLAAAMRRAPAPPLEQAALSGAVPLSPIQHWLFAQDLPAVQHFNQSLLLQLLLPLDAQALEAAAQGLLAHHDALRLRFVQTEEGAWRQWHAETPTQAIVETFDLGGLPAAQQTAAVEEHAERLQGSLDLAVGPLLRIAYLPLGARGARLLLVCHHLVIDGVSWRILLEDLHTAYRQRVHGQAIALPPKTSSFRRWAERLHAYAQSPELAREREFWAQWQGTGTALAADFPQGERSMGASAEATIELSEQETASLARELPAAYRTQIDDALLSALALALRDRTGATSITIDLEGHGREDLFPAIDVSRTVGWFTSLYPVRLDVGETHDHGTVLKSIKEQLRAIPNKGVGYGVLRYLCADPDLAKAPCPPISFNYLGQVDPALAGSGWLTLAPEAHGREQSPGNRATHELDITAIIIAGRLRVSWRYSSQRFRSATIEALAQRYLEHLRGLLAHCRSTQGAYTPSDFPLARLDQPRLDALLAAQHARGEAVEDLYALTGLQEGMLFHALLAPASGVYVEQLCCTVEAALGIPALECALQSMVDRHAVLRSAFLWEGLDRPVQVVYRRQHIALAQLDWRGQDEAQQQEQRQAFLTRDRAQGFNVGRAPLLRFALIRLSETVYEFVGSFHHILCDGWSFALLMQEFLASYAAFAQGRAPRLASVRPYRDYIAWLAEQDRAQAERYWRTALAGWAAPTPLTVDGRYAHRTGHAEHRWQLDAAHTQALEALGRRERLTLNTLIQGAWALLLARYSQQSEVLFGATVSGRPPDLRGIETMVGLFINSVPVRVRIESEALLVDWLTVLQRQNAELRQFEYTPLTELHAFSEVPGGMPLFESLVVFENYPIDQSVAQADQTLPIRRVEVYEQSNYPLTLMVSGGKRLSLSLHYDRERFDEATIERMRGHLDNLLSAMAEQPRGRVGALELLSAQERTQLLMHWNRTASDYPEAETLHQVFEAQAARTPDAIAVICENEELRYAQLNERANRLAHHLRGLGVGPDTPVGLCLDHSPEMIVALLGILKAGGAYLPLDPAYPKEGLGYMLRDAKACLLLTQSALRSLAPAGERVVCLDSEAHAIGTQSAANPTAQSCAANLAYVLYTSGSTGQPKGVMGTHQATLNRLRWMWSAYPYAPDAVACQKTPLSFVDSVAEIFAPLLQGVRLVVLPQATIQDLPTLVTALGQHRVTRMILVPSSLQMLLETIPALAARLPRLREWICSGERLSVELAARFVSVYPEALLINLYGLAEVAADATGHAVVASSLMSAAIPIGRPLANTACYVLDAELHPMPVGVPGELYIGGVCLARGYLHRPGLTAERFLPSLFDPIPGARMYRTGDRARYLPDGNIEYLGRLDHQVKIRGFRIEPGEIEAALGQLPAVREAVVVAHEGVSGDRQLVAYIVPHEDAVRPADRDLRAALQRSLPAHMIPAHFDLLEQLPLTPNGKVDRNALRSRALRAPTERRIAQIWDEVLRARNVGVHSNFFRLGGR